MHFLQQASRGQSGAAQEVHVIDSFMSNWLLQCFLNFFCGVFNLVQADTKAAAIDSSLDLDYCQQVTLSSEA